MSSRPGSPFSGSSISSENPSEARRGVFGAPVDPSVSVVRLLTIWVAPGPFFVPLGSLLSSLFPSILHLSQALMDQNPRLAVPHITARRLGFMVKGALDQLFKADLVSLYNFDN